MTTKTIPMALNGDEAVAHAVRQVAPDVVAAYPITPQTIIVERLSDYVADGEVDTEFINVESEHSALSCVVGASLSGARTFTATASQGLALMHEILFVASGLRCPIVMAVVNRALSAPINIHCDHSDSMASRDASWIQLYVEDAQEAYDTTLQAFKIAEHPEVQLPVMVMLDGFILSHTTMRVDALPDAVVRDFVGKRTPVNVKVMGQEVPYRLDPRNPLTMGPLVLWDYFFELKRQEEEAIRGAAEVIKAINAECAEMAGRSYGNGLFEAYRLEDAELAIVCLGSAAGTVKAVIDRLRDSVKIGLVRLKSFRPFPASELVEAMGHVKAIGVLDRCMPAGASGGPLFNELRSAFYDSGERPIVVDYIYGLGGRDVSEVMIDRVYRNLETAVRQRGPREIVQFVGMRE